MNSVAYTGTLISLRIQGRLADVVLVPVRQHDPLHILPVFNQVGDIGHDNVDAQKLRFREHQPGVDHDDVVFPAERKTVHPELAQPAQGNDFQLLDLHSSSELMLTLPKQGSGFRDQGLEIPITLDLNPGLPLRVVALQSSRSRVITSFMLDFEPQLTLIPDP